GRFLKNYGYTMAFAIGVSLLVSFSLTPSLAARMLRPHTPGILFNLVEAFYRPVERAYMRILEWSLGHRWVVVLASCLALASIVPLAKSIPSSFVAPDDNAQFEVSLRATEGTSAQETALVAERVAQDVRALPGVDHTVVTVA